MTTFAFNDSFVANTKDLTSPGAPCFNDCEQNYYTYTIDNNAALDEYARTAVTDKEHQHLVVAAVAAGLTTNVSTNDLWFRVMRNAGHTGSINDMKAAFYKIA